MFFTCRNGVERPSRSLEPPDRSTRSTISINTNVRRFASSSMSSEFAYKSAALPLSYSDINPLVQSRWPGSLYPSGLTPLCPAASPDGCRAVCPDLPSRLAVCPKQLGSPTAKPNPLPETQRLCLTRPGMARWIMGKSDRTVSLFYSKIV